MPGHRTRQRSKCKAKMLSPAKHIAPNDKRPDKMTWAMSVLQHRQSSQSPRISILFSYSLHASVSGAKTTSIFCPLSVSDNAYKSLKIALNCLSLIHICKCRVHPPAKGFSGFGSKNRHSLRTVFYASCAVLPISVSPRCLPLSACNLFFAAILQTAFQKRLRGPLSSQLAMRKIRLCCG